MSKKDLWIIALIQENKRLQKELAYQRNETFFPTPETIDAISKALGQDPKPSLALREAFKRVRKVVPKELELKSPELPLENVLKDIPIPETTVLADSRTRLTIGGKEFVLENCPECGHPAEMVMDTIEDCRISCSNVDCDCDAYMRGIMQNAIQDWNIFAKCK